MKQKLTSGIVMGTPVAVAVVLFQSLSSCSRPVRTTFASSLLDSYEVTLAIATIGGLLSLVLLAPFLPSRKPRHASQG